MSWDVVMWGAERGIRCGVVAPPRPGGHCLRFALAAPRPEIIWSATYITDIVTELDIVHKDKLRKLLLAAAYRFLGILGPCAGTQPFSFLAACPGPGRRRTSPASRSNVPHFLFYFLSFSPPVPLLHLLFPPFNLAALYTPATPLGSLCPSGSSRASYIRSS